MLDKELKKLKRSDLLEIMIAQSKEVAAVKDQKEILEGHIAQMEDDFARLKQKLDDKDEQIEKLKVRLDEKDEQINRLKEKLDAKDEQFARLKEKLDEKDIQIDRLKARLDKKDEEIAKLDAELAREIDNQIKGVNQIGSIAEAALKLHKIFDAAQAAADEYVEMVKACGQGEEKNGKHDC